MKTILAILTASFWLHEQYLEPSTGQPCFSLQVNSRKGKIRG